MATPRSATYSGVEVKAGLFLAFCAALFVGMLLLYGKVGRMWRERQDLHVLFSSIEALGPDAPVRLNGVDVGRVKTRAIVHLDEKTMEHLRKLTPSDLDFLPLDDEVRRKLRLVPDAEFDGACRASLQGKTMILLVLEVLQEGNWRRYRVDDTVHVRPSLMGNVHVDLVSGNGPPVDPTAPTLMLGHSGGFFSNLARSVDQVKDVLSTVTDVVGVEERRGFMRAAGRFDTILDGMDKASSLVETRGKATSAKLGSIDQSAGGGMDSLGRLFEVAAPDSRRLGETMTAAQEDLGKRFSDLMKEIDGTEEAMKDKSRAIRADVQEAIDASTPHIEGMKENFRVLASTVGGVSRKIGNITGTFGQLIEQSRPEFERIKTGLSNGGTNLAGLRYVRERIDQILSNRDVGEHDYYTAMEIWDRMQRSARWPRDCGDTLGMIRTLLAGQAEGPDVPLVAPADVQRVEQKLYPLALKLGHAAQTIGEAILPPFTGKSGPADERTDPPFKRKRSATYPPDDGKKKKK